MLLIGNGSQFGPPALRDADGKVYEIDRIWKYSEQEDFVVFSMRSEPKGVQVLQLGEAPSLNDAVFAVGNALGEGIVIRDGLYTSDTPEELNGEWKWLRFSAAASPGNSGGPLTDQAGRVIGVVLRKSQSENLNFALPIARVSAIKEGEARIHSRLPVRFPIIDVSETTEMDEHFSLPLPMGEFYSKVAGLDFAALERAQHALLDHNHDRLFPYSAKSAQLLHSGLSAAFPRFMREGQDGQWLASSEQASSFQLDHNGFVEISHGLMRLRRPDDIGLATLYGDSKLYMDLLLKGYPVRRQVGSESVKVTSLGKAQWSSSYTDAFGRTWRINAWAEPWADSVLMLTSLPTPEGYVGFIATAGTLIRQPVLDLQKPLLDYFYVSMGGTLWQWQDFLAQKDMAPQPLSGIKLEIDPVQRVQFRSPRCELTVTPDLVPLSRDSLLWLKLSYFRDGGKVVWDVAGLSVDESAQKHNWVNFWRLSQPESDLPDSFQSQWRKLQGGEFPFNGMISTSNGATRISTTAETPSGDGSTAKVRYTLSAQKEGDQSQDVMAPKLELLKKSFKALE